MLYESLKHPYLKNIVRDAIAATRELGADFFGVGALARNVWFTEHGEEVRAARSGI